MRALVDCACARNMLFSVALLLCVAGSAIAKQCFEDEEQEPHTVVKTEPPSPAHSLT